jgi:hypothetical protein
VSDPVEGVHTQKTDHGDARSEDVDRHACRFEPPTFLTKAPGVAGSDQMIGPEDPPYISRSRATSTIKVASVLSVV